jgi:hypothetical protein
MVNVLVSVAPHFHAGLFYIDILTYKILGDQV